MFDKILVANRGEIAARVIRTCRNNDIPTVAIYSEPDSNAPHVDLADEAYQVGPAHVTKSYLDLDRILEVARETEVDAIHPGYGLLSENPEFVHAVKEAGFTFVGPRGEVMEVMGDKVEARAKAIQADVPVVPGSDGPIEDDTEAFDFASEHGYPVVVKATAGGGGIGMKIANNDDELEKALSHCRRRGASSFGDDTIYVEKYIEHPRHVEIQVFGDDHGNYRHVFERECSVQRRHQKVIEEAPSIADRRFDGLRDSMAEAALRLAEEVDYTNAGTVEFIVDSEGNFYFIEMNTRLQVEHTVTEMITGYDLVDWQLQVAAGRQIPVEQQQMAFDGHAIECRIYAEDPEKRFMPSPGPIEKYSEPSGEGIRIDSGVRQGYEVTRYYDPLLAKLIAAGSDRTDAISRMKKALDDYTIEGLTTNIEMHRSIMDDQDFVSGDYHSGWLENRHG